MADLCGVCASNPRRYKCPTCQIPLPAHDDDVGDTPPTAPTSTPAPAAPTPSAPPSKIPSTTTKSPAETLDALIHSRRLATLLATHPALAHQLQGIYESTLEPDESDWEAASRGFRGGYSRGGRGRGRGGRGARSGETRRMGPWTQQRGDEEGLRRIAKARAKGEKGGMGEFVEMVLGTVGGEEEGKGLVV
ncbi:MAG: hypothetical protein M1828_004858 [Chrysothrix sp. TS-e1954]|nr:MAG: hypothetical protein M1828_004858 [Chrysothrix sp. TS-e1954]